MYSTGQGYKALGTTTGSTFGRIFYDELTMLKNACRQPSLSSSLEKWKEASSFTTYYGTQKVVSVDDLLESRLHQFFSRIFYKVARRTVLQKDEKEVSMQQPEFVSKLDEDLCLSELVATMDMALLPGDRTHTSE